MMEKLSKIFNRAEGKTSHLKEGYKPIFVCITSSDDFKKLNSLGSPFLPEESHGLDYEGTTGKGYFISYIDRSNKKEEGFLQCTGIVVVGFDEKTKQEISFLTHQNPDVFLSKGVQFVARLRAQLVEFNERCKTGTVDAIIVGGKVSPTDKQQYIDSIRLLSQEVKQILGFEPVVANGPKNSGGWDNIYLDTQNRRLYMIRSKVNNNFPDFRANDIDNQKSKWGEEV